MKVIGFVGGSGTGKSYRAISVSKKNDIDCIIDDGLFIDVKNGKILAGYSAKREPTKLASVRRALFVDSEHAKEVVKSINIKSPDKIMILGTSDQMVRKIADVLCLPEIENIIRIEDVATPDEISDALKIRGEQGKHIIPVPAFEIKKDFSGYFIDTLKTFTKAGRQKVLENEKTVVRPTFSYLGSFQISQKAILAIIKRALEDTEGVLYVGRVQFSQYRANLTVVYSEITVVLKNNIKDIAKTAQKNAIEKIEELTGINTLILNVIVKAVSFND